MKKLLSLLSVLTITGTAVPTTIAASSYQKEEALNSEINSSQTNNLENLNRQKREINYSSCPIINIENPLYYKEDFFQVYYVSAGHDKIKTNLSLKTALVIEKMFYENSKIDFMIYLSNLFKKMEQKDNTGWGGSILDTDHSTLVDFIYDHYSYFHDKVLELSKNKNYNMIEIETNRLGEWNPNYIYLINKK
ncbi:MAG: hypothetical protein OHM56_03220 [Spiroplasma phoeniceum]|nr:MAG: hypothetical protein OHM57_02675 [Spiroplasma phoeniceum]UZQ32977.1 MAG: hypothetical protein OHM56_03220 [Spiroplasma phoeniceum]